MTSPLLVPRSARFRHVVFGASDGRRRVVNYAPQPTPAPARPRGGASAAPLEQEDAAFVDWLFERAALDAGAYRPETLRRRLGACLRALRVPNTAAARRLIERDPSQVQVAVGALMIGVTSFFRDSAVFDHLTYTVLPLLPRPPLPRRVWCAACSDGDEMYSVAILLAEMDLLAGASLLGTDCRGAALERARQGRYDASAVRDVPSPWRDKYFAREGRGTLVVTDALRAAVQWRRADVTRLQEPGGWDLILCRNMAMYLRPPVAERLWQQLELALRPGGFLVLGKAERPIGTERLSLVGPCIYRRDRG